METINLSNCKNPTFYLNRGYIKNCILVGQITCYVMNVFNNSVSKVNIDNGGVKIVEHIFGPKEFYPYPLSIFDNGLKYFSTKDEALQCLKKRFLYFYERCKNESEEYLTKANLI